MGKTNRNKPFKPRRHEGEGSLHERVVPPKKGKLGKNKRDKYDKHWRHWDSDE